MSQAARLFHICRRLSDGAAVTAASLQDELDVARATIFRDIALLRDQLNAPIVWDAQAETLRFAEQRGAGARFMLPGLWMDATQLYGMLTVINIASALDPGVAETYRSEFRRLLKKVMVEYKVKAHGIDRKIIVELPQTGEAARTAMLVIGPALLLDRPVRLFAEGLDDEGLLAVPTALRLKPDGWWLDYATCGNDEAGSIPLARVRGAHSVSA